LQKIAQDNDLLTKETSAKVVQGWKDKAKGLLQVLWEHGWINENNLAQYTIKGNKDAFGVLTVRTLRRKNCRQKMGVYFDCTPKCHCELAGEGIEYSWGCTKNYYQNIDLVQKKGKENFQAAVMTCLSREVLTTERI